MSCVCSILAAWLAAAGMLRSSRAPRSESCLIAVSSEALASRTAFGLRCLVGTPTLTVPSHVLPPLNLHSPRTPTCLPSTTTRSSTPSPRTAATGTCTATDCVPCMPLHKVPSRAALGLRTSNMQPTEGWHNRGVCNHVLLRAGAGARTRRRKARTSLSCPRGWSPSWRARHCTPVSACSVECRNGL